MSKLYQDEYADDVYLEALQDLNKLEKIQPGRDQATKELLHVMMHLENPRNRYITVRPIDLAFAFVECIWIMRGRDDLKFILPWNARYKNYSDDGDILHGAYGYRLRVHQDVDQLTSACNALKLNPTRRDVVLTIYDPTVDLSSIASPASKDIPCNLMIHPLIRDGKLEFLVVNRSNDLIWGVPYNFIQFTVLQEVMAGWLGLELGAHVRVSDSLHIYERHWEHAKDIVNKEPVILYEVPDLRLSWETSAKVFSVLDEHVELLSTARGYEEVMGTFFAGYSMLHHLSDETSEENVLEYTSWLNIIAAERLRRLNKISEAAELASKNTYFIYKFIFGNWLKEKSSNEQQ